MSDDPKPHEGGSYVRQPDGTLVRETQSEATGTTPPADETAAAPRRRQGKDQE